MTKEKKAPLVRLSKRDYIDPKKAMAIRVGSIVVALILSSIPIMLTGVNPITAYSVMIQGSLGKSYYIQDTVKKAIPLLICAIGIAPCFKMGFWNIGAEGQLTFGAICASFFAINFGAKLPSAVILPIMAIAAAIGGAIWGFIPGFFKAKYNTNETLFTLMMNYIAIGMVKWLQGGQGLWEGRAGTQLIPNFHENTYLPSVFGIHCGWIIALVLVVFIYIYMNKTKHGYEVAVIGDSLNTARYAGMNVGWVMMRTMLLSGAISGIAGFVILAGANHTLTSTIADGAGFTSITISWLSRLNSFVMIAISMLLAIIAKGSSYLNKKKGVPAAAADIVSGILLFCMLSGEFFIKYKMVFRKRSEHKE